MENPEEHEVLVDYEAGEDDEEYHVANNIQKDTNASSDVSKPVDETNKPAIKTNDENINIGSSFAPMSLGNPIGSSSSHPMDKPLSSSRHDDRRSNGRERNVKSGTGSFGVYIPPFRRKQLEKEQSEKKEEGEEPSTTPSIHIQRQKWEDLKKAINGTINRLNTQTIKELIHSLFKSANLVRGKGLLAKAVLRAATTSPTYAPVYAALIAVINTKLPEVGELILARSILCFRRSYARQDRGMTMAITNFIACLFNQGLCHEILCLQLLTVLLEGDPTDDSVEVAVQFTKVAGMALVENSPTGVHAVMERFRSLLHDGRIGRRVQYKIEELMKIRKNKFKQFPALQEELDLVEREEQITFEMGLDDEDLQKEDHLDVFKFDEDWVQNENDWIEIRREVIGEDSDDEDGSDDDETDDSSDEDEDDSDDDEDGVLVEAVPEPELKKNQITEIHDMSEKDLIHLRRTIYLTIMSSATFEECSHKLSKMDIPLGKEIELINMIIECCSQERTFLRYYGLIAARFCLMHKRWSDAFHESFIAQYNTIHRLETNKLRNVAKLFAHLLHTDSLSWSCMSVIHLNEDETTSSSRIFLKILVQEMAEAMGIGTLVKRLEPDDPETAEWFKELFPRDNPRKTRYAINFFTSIGLGPLTDGLREYLKNAPKLIMQQAEAAAKKDGNDSDESSVLSSSSSSSSSLSSSSSGSYSSSSSGSYSSYSSSSGSYSRRKGRGRKRGGRKRRSRSYSSSSSSSSYSRSVDSREKTKKKKNRRSKKSLSRSVERDRSNNSKKARSDDSPIGSEVEVRKGERSLLRSRSRSRSPSVERRRKRNDKKDDADSKDKIRESRKRERSSSRSQSSNDSDRRSRGRKRRARSYSSSRSRSSTSK